MLLSALGKIDFKEEDFAVSRKIEYIAVEKIGVIILNTFFMLAMIGGGLTAFYWRIRTSVKSSL